MTQVARNRPQKGETSPLSLFFSIILLAGVGYGAYIFLQSQAAGVRAKGASLAADAKQSSIYESIHVGMAGNDVKAAIGPPERVEDKNDTFKLPEKWVYDQGHVTVEFQNGFVTGKHKQ